METGDIISMAGLMLAIGSGLLGFAFKITRELARLAAALEGLSDRMGHGLEDLHRRIESEADARREGDSELARQIGLWRGRGQA